MQDRWNKSGRMTVNYLGHFEGPDHFGCNAGTKMIYIDAFGEVSPCVFAPMSFGNVRERPLAEIWSDMRERFAPGSSCFVIEQPSPAPEDGSTAGCPCLPRRRGS